MTKILNHDNINAKDNGNIPPIIGRAMDAYANLAWQNDQAFDKNEIVKAQRVWAKRRKDLIRWLKNRPS